MAALVSETGSSYNSAVDWDIFTQFGTLRDPDLLRTCAQPNRNRKLTRDVNGRHRENFNDVISHNYSADRPIHMKFDTPTQNEMPVTIGRLKSKP